MFTPDSSEEPSFLRRPRKSPEDYWAFINLNGEIDVFDHTRAGKPWIGRCFRGQDEDAGCERDDEIAYYVRRPGDEAGNWIGRSLKSKDENRFGELKDQLVHRTADARFVLIFLVYSEPGEPLNPFLFRELSPEDASLWFILNEHELPESLKPVPRRDPATDPSSRLNREWKPPNGGLLKSADVNQDSERGDIGTRATVEPMSKPPEAPADPVEETITMLGRATGQIELIRFLAARDKRQAHLETINKDLRKHQCSKKEDLRNTRRLAERARQALEEKNCPLRLYISGNVVRLIDVNLSHD